MLKKTNPKKEKKHKNHPPLEELVLILLIRPLKL
jgi:hypothetical protein